MDAPAAVRLRPLVPADREAVAAMTAATGMFSTAEVAIALEVFDGALAQAGAASPDYVGLGAEADGRLAGWVCWGPTPCTVGTWDCYWLVVDPARHGRGIGSRLLDAMEAALRAAGARLVVVETAGRPDYAPTRAFYAARGYRVAATIPEFYAPGDDQVVFVKSLDRAAVR